MTDLRGKTSGSLEQLRIIFMGTPDFAVASLDALLKAGFHIVAVVTAPDKPGGRGMQLQSSAVKKFAVQNNLPVLQPVKLKDPAFIEELLSLKADLQVVVAFRMLPELIWRMPPLGTVNLHGSLLPQYRGAAPIHWAVINGEKETGVTTFRLQHAIDTGGVLLQSSFPIGENETTGEVHDRMKLVGAELLVKTVKGLAEGTLQEIPQSVLEEKTSAPLRHAPKIFTETCVVDWGKSLSELHNFVRGLSPFPGAIASLEGKTLKLYRSEKEEKKHTHPPGIVFSDQKTFLKFSCSGGYLHILDLQLEGKKRMLVADFLRGYHWRDRPST